jgi:NADH-quinone oxidoreductase subunit C
VSPERAREMLAALPGVTVGEGTAPVVAHVATEQWQAAARFAKETLGCTFFNFCTAIDWKVDGLEMIAWVDNLDDRLSVQLRTKLGAGNTICPSLVPVYRGANWMERECYDMFGLQFAGHPDPRRILLADDWEGHPLLKSYAVDTPHPPYR